MAKYRMVYGDREQVVCQTLDDVELEQEDGWTVFFRGNTSILRARDEHVHSIELIEQETGAHRGRRSPALTVGDVMRSAVTTVERDAHLAAAAYLITRSGGTALVVINDHDQQIPVAVITDTDVMRAVADGTDPNKVRISELIGTQPITVSSHATLTSATAIMLSAQLSHVPVVANCRLVGMLDLSDAARALLEQRSGTEHPDQEASDVA